MGVKKPSYLLVTLSNVSFFELYALLSVTLLAVTFSNVLEHPSGLWPYSDILSPHLSDYVDSLPSGDPCFNMTDPDQQMCLGYLGPLYQDGPISAETACQWVFHWIANLMIMFVSICHQTRPQISRHTDVCNG